MFDTIRMTVELMQAQHTVDHSQLSMLQFSQLESSSSSSSDFSLSDYADRYTTARDAYLEVCSMTVLFPPKLRRLVLNFAARCLVSVVGVVVTTWIRRRQRH